MMVMSMVKEEFEQTESMRGVKIVAEIYACFFRNAQPSVSRVLPPVGWHSTVEHEPHTTTVCAAHTRTRKSEHDVSSDGR